MGEVFVLIVRIITGEHRHCKTAMAYFYTVKFDRRLKYVIPNAHSGVYKKGDIKYILAFFITIVIYLNCKWVSTWWQWYYNKTTHK
jgi:hypothetical protein